MSKFETENLILLEFLVAKVGLDVEVRKTMRKVLGETYVSFQFLDNAPVLIHERDFLRKRKSKYHPQEGHCTKQGKSCLFCLSPEQAQQASNCFDVHVEVFKKLKPEVLPSRVFLGESLISVCNLFNELMEAIYVKGETPAARSIKDYFRITNTKGETVGLIAAFIRMSCFGKLIVTEFKMGLEGNMTFKLQKSGEEDNDRSKGDGRNIPAASAILEHNPTV